MINLSLFEKNQSLRADVVFSTVINSLNEEYVTEFIRFWLIPQTSILDLVKNLTHTWLLILVKSLR